VNLKLWDTRYQFRILSGYQKSCYDACSLNSREQDHWEANSCLSNREISRILWNSNICYRIHKGSPPRFSVLSLSPRLEKWFVAWLSFYGEVLLAPCPVPQARGPPLAGFRDCLFSIFAAALHIEYAVALLVEALRYKPEGRGFDSLCGHCVFFSLNPSYPTMALASTQPQTERNTKGISLVGGKDGRCVGLRTLHP